MADLREMAISMAKSHRDWCKKVGCKMMLSCVPIIYYLTTRTWTPGKKQNARSRRYQNILTAHLFLSRAPM